MLHQNAFDLDGRYVLAGTANDVLLAVEEGQRAIGVAPNDVAAVKPAAAPSLGGGLGVLQVLAKEAVTWLRSGVADEQFAGFADCGVRPALGDDARFQLRAGPAEATRTDMARLLGCDDHRAGAGFGHGPGLDQWESETFLERRLQRRIDAGAEAEAYRMIGVLRAFFRSHQHRRHDTEIMNDGRASLADAVPPALWVKAIEHDQAAARRDHGHGRIGH